MSNYRNPYDIANEIMMRRFTGTYSGTFLLVEGRSDELVYQNFVDDSKCEIMAVYTLIEEDKNDGNSGNYGGAKEMALKVLEILDANQMPGILAVVDADFWELQGVSPNSHNLLVTDTHDLETMIIKSPALEKVISELASEDKIANFHKDVRETLLEDGMWIGYLRWISEEQELGLSFQKLPFKEFMTDSLVVKEDELVRKVKNKSQKHKLPESEIIEELRSRKNRNDDPWLVCCGHDLVEILSLGFRKAWSSHKATEVEPELLERYLRLAYEESYFCQTELYKSIQEWEQANSPYQVLR